MSIWTKIESFGGLTSGIGAMVVALVALQQSYSGQEEIDQLLDAMKGMDRFFEAEKREGQVVSLMAEFRNANWKPMAANELYATDTVQKLELTKEEFVLLLRAGEDNNLIRAIADRTGNPEIPARLFIWDPALRLD